MLSDQQLKNILLKAEILSSEKFDNLQEEAKTLGKSIEYYLNEKNIISPLVLYENAAAYYKIPFIDLKNQTIRKDILFLIPEPIATTHNIIAYDANDKEIKLAVLDPDDMEIFEFIKKKTGLNVKISLTTPDNIKETLKQYHKSLKAEFNYLSEEKEDGKGATEENKDLKKLAADLPVVRIVDTLLEYSIMEGASDIHIEPEEKNVLVRYRIDGILRNVMVLPKTVQSGIVARIKILANLKVDEHRLPQDGRFKISTNEYKVAFRVSIIPTFDGEKLVLRLLNEKAQVLTLEQLGLQKNPLEVLKSNVKKPHGIILVTGPTGSGKTTTLYTVLNILNTPEVNISTVEDPIEYRMPHVNQSQVNAKIGYTFASGLRAFLRQDPNIIMVGEIRDQETAEIAIQAAMTGHLVLSTIHTNDAAGTMPRLSEMGVPTFLIATTVNIIIAQRLVRKICTNCIQSYNLEPETIKELEKQLNIENILKTLEKEKIIIDAKKGLKSMLFYRGKGCKHCNNTGYKGRIGIYEILENSETISALMLKNASAHEINREAIKNGMLAIVEDGFIKARNGITTLEEVLRVTKE
ncbi:MAG: Type II secretion system protein E [Candidatus Falkowbacteria bacterium GW2011_GWC2_38_22]|uniref:Type II secretion system protein E n=1 Tax=Candidatus Falkowbacteria bacterium GW2011_GWE1_38_31 TaxID=1618638 RepID=A0A0G0JTA5_9BACT|nr:MAG: Type II secretion system protein E [Candidatus Falkowbacteria bacterium GW2011_GWF2_38_1205]KKQ61995.1 MAG: Type II secretion system protein E [Candidatus Falkowbacteria bacterium GW2011_GWC2_38_22]KKQ63843.1 MAG: Type II secretion system protein E [Candidatus Falkowbacteria bacterium GW2011_GWF1_38_22]KKQ66100.1 MAG: Type II secretion system protein E [Candidatus Falkowbacteria bacterium GW2011_GWE2_38_254]KKQ70703.1 MAG: Type II secretion system protein E [Candidatus Falkowbacteria ba